MHHTDDILPLSEQVGLVRLFGEYLARVDVPLFFTISGFLLARKLNRPGWYSEALASRFHSLLVPFLLWNLAVYFVTALLRPGEFPFSPLGGFCFEVRPVCGASWYLRNLFYFVLFSPFVLPLLRTRVGACCSVLGFWLAVSILTCGGFIGWDRLGVINFAFFLTGAAAACHYSSVHRVFIDVRMHLRILPMILFLGCVWVSSAWFLYCSDCTQGAAYGFVGLCPQPSFYTLMIFIGSIFFSIGTLMAVSVAGQWRVPKLISNVTFVIYLLHTEMLSVIGRPCLTFLRTFAVPTPFALLIIYGLICVLCIALAHLWRCLSPKTYTLFCGGRG